jgi:hypothetical protein
MDQAHEAEHGRIVRWRSSCSASLCRAVEFREHVELMTTLRRSGRALAIAVVALGLAACDATDDASATATASADAIASASTAPSASGSAAPTQGGSGEETSVFELEEGDCFDASGDQVETVTVVDCASTHVYEVFAIFDHEAGADEPYPGDEELLEYADAECQPHFEDYVAIDYQESIYWITSVTPSAETWEQGDDREIVCALKLGEEGEPTTGSAEGTGE